MINNEPLKLEELLQMDGKPVYVQFGDGVQGWVIVGVDEYPDNTPPTVFLYSFDMENNGHSEPDTDFLNLECSKEFCSNGNCHFGLHRLGWRAYKYSPYDLTTNISKYNDVDEFLCEKCGIRLKDYVEVKVDLEDEEDENIYEYSPKFCPNCGRRIVE